MESKPVLGRIFAAAALLWGAVGYTLAAASAPAVDVRFGLVGTGGAPFAAKFGFRYYTLEGNYAEGKGSVFSSVDPANDPAAGFSVVREVAKLNVRTDALGQTNVQFQAKLNQYAKDLAVWYLTPAWARGSKPAFVWYSPNAKALIQAESLQIVETIRREKAKSPAVTGTVWEIGNEPNLFPAITAAEYGAIFANYYRVIKAEDPAAKVAMGSLFMPEPSTDLKAKFAEELESRMRTELQAAGYYHTLNSSGIFAGLVNDVKSTLLARMLALPAKEYLRQALAAAKAVHAPAGAPDVVTYHVYPYDDRAPFQDSAALHAVIDTTIAGIDAMLAAAGASAPLWITEFGNVEQGLTEAQVAERMRRVIGAFWDNASIAMWFHYKSTGSDDQFALFSSGPAPITRLALDAGFGPASGDFSCDKLNAVGLAYWKASHGGEACADPVIAPDPNPDPDPDPDPIPVPIPIPVSILDSLRPVILNAEASILSSSGSIAWAWERAPIPELPSATAASVLARMEIYRDTAAPPLLRADSLTAPLVKPQLAAGSGPIWVRVRLSAAGGVETAWSAWRLLQWEAAPSATASPGTVEARVKAIGRLPWLRDASGAAVDARGRRLLPRAR
jgi:hypothetical protein